MSSILQHSVKHMPRVPVAHSARAAPSISALRNRYSTLGDFGPTSRCINAQASAGEAPVGEPPRRSYAILHDFCMQIPYGGIMVLSGLILGVKGPLAAGVLLSLTGMGILMCARASLRAWKIGRSSTAYTLLSAMAAAYLTWIFGLKFKMQVVKAVVWGPLLLRPPFALCFLSATMTAFLLYNVWAGGNAPPQAKH